MLFWIPIRNGEDGSRTFGANSADVIAHDAVGCADERRATGCIERINSNTEKTIAPSGDVIDRIIGVGRTARPRILDAVRAVSRDDRVGDGKATVPDAG